MYIERKIGEIFEVDGKIVKCIEVKSNSCFDCIFYPDCFNNGAKQKCGLCSSSTRRDGKNVSFVEAQK